MPGEARREAERPPWFAVVGTITLAPLFAGSVIVLSPYLLFSGWKLDAPFFGWSPSRWIGGALVIFPFPAPRLLGALRARGARDAGTLRPTRASRRQGPFRYVRNPAYLCAVSIIGGQGLFLASPSVLRWVPRLTPAIRGRAQGQGAHRDR